MLVGFKTSEERISRICSAFFSKSYSGVPHKKSRRAKLSMRGELGIFGTKSGFQSFNFSRRYKFSLFLSSSLVKEVLVNVKVDPMDELRDDNEEDDDEVTGAVGSGGSIYGFVYGSLDGGNSELEPGNEEDDGEE